jgi:plastocyanin
MRGIHGVLAMAVLFVGCGGGGTAPATPTGGGGGSTPVPTAPVPTTSVTVSDNFFDPRNATVVVGATVTWTWTGYSGHNVTFATGASAPTQTTGTFQRAFPTAGTFPYSCTLHSGMTGSIIVQ